MNVKFFWLKWKIGCWRAKLKKYSGSVLSNAICYPSRFLALASFCSSTQESQAYRNTVMEVVPSVYGNGFPPIFCLTSTRTIKNYPPATAISPVATAANSTSTTTHSEIQNGPIYATGRSGKSLSVSSTIRQSAMLDIQQSTDLTSALSRFFLSFINVYSLEFSDWYLRIFLCCLLRAWGCMRARWNSSLLLSWAWAFQRLNDFDN